MITDGFNKNSKPFITAEMLYGKKERNDLICIITYKKELLDYVLATYPNRVHMTYPTTNGIFTVYEIEYNSNKYLMYNTPIGATMTSIIMYEVSTITGCHQFIFFGSCGVLNEEKCRGKVIVPTEAYRDEGISYHYKEPTDYITIRHSDYIANFLKENNINYITGRVWTTDGFYMETETKLDARKKEGCLAVEMEIAGVQATADYYEIDTYPILFPADSLDDINWEQADLGGSKELVQQIKSLEVAIKIAESLLRK